MMGFYLIVCASNYHPGGYISGNMGRLLLPQQYLQSTLLGVQNYQLRDFDSNLTFKCCGAHILEGWHSKHI